MFLKLIKDVWKNKLISMPETGMGYQCVDIILTNGDVFRTIVSNAEFVEVPRGMHLTEDDIVDIKLCT